MLARKLDLSIDEVREGWRVDGMPRAVEEEDPFGDAAGDGEDLALPEF